MATARTERTEGGCRPAGARRVAYTPRAAVTHGPTTWSDGRRRGRVRWADAVSGGRGRSGRRRGSSVGLSIGLVSPVQPQLSTITRPSEGLGPADADHNVPVSVPRLRTEEL